MRLDLPVIDAGADLVRDLAVLTGHREDLIADRVRMISRLRHLLTSVFPSLERAFDYSAFQTGAGSSVVANLHLHTTANPAPTRTLPVRHLPRIANLVV